MANPFLRTTAVGDSSTFRSLKSDRLERVGVVVLDVDGVFTDGKSWQDSSGAWRRAFSVRDTIGLRALRKAGLRVVVLSSSQSTEIKEHFDFVGVDVYRDHLSEAEMTHVSDQILRSLNMSGEQAAFVRAERDGSVGLNVHSHSVYTTSRHGGDGAVLEICNLILQYTTGAEPAGEL